ncbi:ATPase subunit of ABC transporter with duplicated ATPase domains [Curtobacterium luteum]|uniref:ABC transporter ATP-binding protein n=1 Tax=Curtobacterium luteum TaxID=33881 RepID=A0A8H9GB75_9MICO|nr:ABC-F family ATP-binding cassette domain-containing protein [Curtobacterium luteum]MBM7803988.1 ATPase subunit of ABC transporter with duplicated ATPase domains [Curtobacterium luteum]NUU49482.1 ABC-F family ATP-binding cassette domain-containing protein [Curtobacterium luteum]GGL05496.1 ABC transporter ATP-binding protein [Curtobacterium luteum]
MAHLLGAENVHLEFPTRVVFDSVTLGIDEGDRIGVVGRNGDGKSTLLALLSQRIDPDDGRVTHRRGLTVGYLDQRDVLPAGATVGATVVGDRAEHEWAGDPKIRDVIGGLVSDIPWEANVDDLSGGQRRRIALAKLLVGDWDVLFLDEPTNHLDVEGIQWLADHIKRRWSANQGGLVVVTHDRWFLDAVSTDTWEVHDGIVEPFEGGYAAYILQRVERDRQAAASEQRRQNLARKELAWLRRGAPARTSKPKFRIDAANALIDDVPPIRDTVALSQMATARLGKDVVDLLDAGVAFGDDVILRDVEWRIAPGERTGILGPNGAGKSTLLNLVSGTLQPTTGRVKTGKTVQIAVLDQQLADLQQYADDRVREVVARKKTSYVADGKEMTPSQLLERLGFTSAQLSTPVKDLSGGQKRRLQLMLILLDEPNVLILDEPTNDLDTDMLAAMEDLLDTWPGTLLVVSHDRYLLERVTDQQYAVLGGHLRHLPGGVDEYMRLRASGSVPATASAAAAAAAGRPDTAGGTGSAGSVAGSGTVGGSGRPAAGGAGGAAGAGGADGAGGAAGAGAAPAAGAGVAVLSGAERRAAEKEMSALDRRIARIGADRQEVLDAFAAHDQSDYAGLGALQARLAGLEAEVEQLEERWLEVAEQLGV